MFEFFCVLEEIENKSEMFAQQSLLGQVSLMFCAQELAAVLTQPNCVFVPTGSSWGVISQAINWSELY